LPGLLTRAKDFSRTADTTNERERGNEMNINIKKVKDTQYTTRLLRFECEGEEYLAEVYIGKTISDYNLYEGNKKLDG
jgi:hypothetical protein